MSSEQEKNTYVDRKITLITKCPDEHWKCGGGTGYGVKCLGDLTNFDGLIKGLGYKCIFKQWAEEHKGDYNIGSNIHVYASNQNNSVVVLKHGESIRYDCLQQITIHAPECAAADFIKSIANEFAKMPPKFTPSIQPKGAEEEAMFSGYDWWSKLKYKPGPWD